MPNQTILVIEDDPAVARATRKMLQKSGFTVFLANSGEAGEIELQSHPGCVDTVLIDFTLPGSNGIEVLDRMRGGYPHLRFFLMSGYPQQSFTDDLSELGLSGFIQKPFMMAELVSAITAISPDEALQPARR